MRINYLSGAVFIDNSIGTDSLYYSYSDAQGSLIALTDDAGTVKRRFAYDPWGKRRDADNWNIADNGVNLIINRGYTGHEHLDAFGIINMNGRVYDPYTAQFFSPDPYVQSPGDWLNYNRYGYCLGNPFKYTDPSGEFVWFVPIIFAAVNLATDMIVSHGQMNAGQIIGSLVSGAIGGCLSGATTVASAFISAATSQVNRFLPSIPIIQTSNFNLSISPMVGFGTHGFNLGASLNASGKTDNGFVFSGGIGIGYNSGMNSLGEQAGGEWYGNAGAFVGYNDGKNTYGAGYSYNGFFGGKTDQGVGAIHLQIANFGLRFDEDLIGDGKDRYRTGGLMLSYRIDNNVTIAIGGSMITGDPDKNKRLPYGSEKTYIEDGVTKTAGTYDDCYETMHDLRGGNIYAGFISKGQSYFLGTNSEGDLHSIQNAIHSSSFTKHPAYFADRGFGTKLFSYYGGYNPFYLNY